MRADSDDFVRADDFAGFGGGQIVLADMHSIGFRKSGHVGSVIDDAKRSVIAAKPDELLCPMKQLAAIQTFLAELQAIRAAEQRQLCGLKPGLAQNCSVINT